MSVLNSKSLSFTFLLLLVHLKNIVGFSTVPNHHVNVNRNNDVRMKTSLRGMRRPILDQIASTIFKLEMDRVDSSSVTDDKGRVGEPMEWAAKDSMSNRFSEIMAGNGTANRLVSKKSTKFNWTMAKKLLVTLYVSAELILHGLAFVTVNDLTKNYNIFFDTVLFSYLSLSRKRCGKQDYKLYSLFALEHIIFLAIKVVSPSLYLEIFATKETIPLLYNTATFVECVAYSKVLVGL